MNPMMKLLIANRKQERFQVDALASADIGASDEATIYLYDIIVDSDVEADFWGGISPQKFVKELNAISAPIIHLRVDSPGGSVFSARAIEQAIREHKSKIIVHVDGFAASAASFLIMPADEIIMSPGAFLMIHNAWSIVYGNAADLRKEAGRLDKVDVGMGKTYSVKSGQPEEDIQSWMSQETWFDAEEAVALGFADRVAEEKSPEAKSTAWDLSAFSRAPITGVAPPSPPAQPAPENKIDTDTPSAPTEPASPIVDRTALIRQAAVTARLLSPILI